MVELALHEGTEKAAKKMMDGILKKICIKVVVESRCLRCRYYKATHRKAKKEEEDE